MSRWLPLVCLFAATLTGCSDSPSTPATLSDKERQVIEFARRAVAQFDDWADKAEFTIVRKGTEWHVTARRVVYPDRTGNQRYVPWGRREIIIDDAGKVVSYSNRK